MTRVLVVTALLGALAFGVSLGLGRVTDSGEAPRPVAAVTPLPSPPPPPAAEDLRRARSLPALRRDLRREAEERRRRAAARRASAYQLARRRDQRACPPGVRAEESRARSGVRAAFSRSITPASRPA